MASSGCGGGGTEPGGPAVSVAPKPKGPAAGKSSKAVTGIEKPGKAAETKSAPEPVKAAVSPAALYSQHCAACHGEKGDGNGLAARFLYPKPRNFREGRFRMVSTTNLVPSDDDLLRAVTRGLPGSAMVPFGHLSQEARLALVEAVKSFVHDGVVERVKREAAEFGEEVKPEELAAAVKRRMEAGPALAVPADLSAENKESLARGRELYVKSCATCHGDTGKGDGVQEQKDEFNLPIRPRDFTRGIFKGGREREQLFARITLGIPGTPMPASSTLKPAEVGDMVNYILSLSDPATSQKVEHRRSKVAARRVTESLAGAVPESVWSGIPATSIVVSPLWWSDRDEPDLRVQAVHDGQTLAVRLTWRDATRDEQAVRPQDFADMAAVQLFQGERSGEPFLGMGTKEGAVDLWLWSAAAQADTRQYADVDTTYPHMSVDGYPFEKAGDPSRPHATDGQPSTFLSAWGAGNQRSDPTHVLPGANLHAKGLGSLTMRPRVSQVVNAQGEWKDGSWTVVLRRPLTVPSEAGIPLAAGQRRSIAFALWDGAHRDRNGQKLISIWQDLELD